MAELMQNGSNSEKIPEGKGKDHVAETNHDNKISSSIRNATKINKNKNSVSSDALGLFSNYSCEKGSFSSESRLGMASEEHCDEEMGLSSSIRTVNGGMKRAVAEFIPGLDLSTVGSCSRSINLFSNQSGFGSPVPVMRGFEHRTSLDDDQDGCSGFVTSSSVKLPAESTIPAEQSSAQLTIFYGGLVNVYDDIPADKAQVIMLTASHGNYSRHPHIKVQKGCGSQTEQKMSVPVMKLSDGSGMPTDLPIARKHSLQRFLEKRKERTNANAKSPYTTAKAGNTNPQQHPLSPPVWLHSNSPPK